MMIFNRELIIKITVVALSFLATLLICELILRFLPYNSGIIASHVDDNQPVYRFLPEQITQYSQDWDMKNNRKRYVNKDGFLSNIEYEKNATRPLIVVIGDSFIEAMQVNWAKSAHGLLHQQLSPEVRVYSFGAAYASLAQYLAWASYAHTNYEPDMLIVNIVGNDFLQKLPKEGEAYSGGFQGMAYFNEGKKGELILQRSDRPRESWTIRMLRKSALVAYLYRNLGITKVFNRIKSGYIDFFSHRKSLYT